MCLLLFMLDSLHLHNGRKPTIDFTWLHQAPPYGALIKLMHGQLKSVCISESLEVSVFLRGLCPELPNYLRFSDKFWTARACCSYFRMMFFSSNVHFWPQDVTVELQPVVGPDIPTWESEERGLLTHYMQDPTIPEPPVTRKLPSGCHRKYSCNGKGDISLL